MGWLGACRGDGVPLNTVLQTHACGTWHIHAQTCTMSGRNSNSEFLRPRIFFSGAGVCIRVPMNVSKSLK